MNRAKKVGLIYATAFVAVLDVFIYWNNHLYYRAKREPAAENRIRVLERSVQFCPLNDLVYYELGKTYLGSGITVLSNPAVARSRLEKSVQNLERSVRINPASSYSHLYLAQALDYLDILAPGKASHFYDEYKKAAELAGEDSQVYTQVGQFFLSRWPRLSPPDQEFTIDVLRKIAAGKKPDEISQLMNVWEMNSKDFAVMDEILPSDPRVYRQYAQFLGEKSLALEERHKYLARAELLEFQRAKRDFRSGELELFNFRFQEAGRHFQSTLSLLKSIRFYQNLVRQDSINGEDYLSLLRSAWLNLAKCRIEQGAGFGDVEASLLQYLALEDRPKEVAGLEAYLRQRGILSREPGRGFDNLNRLGFEIWLSYKKNQYRDIINIGREIEEGFVVVPEKNKGDFVRILQLVGDSYQKIDFLYDAGDTYRKALKVDPANLETLLRLRENSERLGEAAEARRMDKTIGEIISPAEISPRDSTLDKGLVWTQKLILKRGKADLELLFESPEGSGEPLLAVFFNGQVVWEDYLEDNIILLNVETRAGDNLLQVVPVNRSVRLTRIAYRDSADADRSQILRSYS